MSERILRIGGVCARLMFGGATETTFHLWIKQNKFIQRLLNDFDNTSQKSKEYVNGVLTPPCILATRFFPNVKNCHTHFSISPESTYNFRTVDLAVSYVYDMYMVTIGQYFDGLKNYKRGNLNESYGKQCNLFRKYKYR